MLYLTPALWGGMALLVAPQPSGQYDLHAISLPDLTQSTVRRWLIRTGAQQDIVGGFLGAYNNMAFSLLSVACIMSSDKAVEAQRLAMPLRDIFQCMPDKQQTLRQAMKAMFQEWLAEVEYLETFLAPETRARAAEIRSRFDAPISAIIETAYFRADLNWHYQQIELDLVLQTIGSTLMTDLRRGLDDLGFGGTEREIALIPCGQLGILPLHAAGVGTDAQGELIPFMDTCILTLQPSARTLSLARKAKDRLAEASGPVITVGDPQLRAGSAVAQLPWARLEARTIAGLARLKGREGSHAILATEATKARVLSEFQAIRAGHTGAWVHFATHGHADFTDPRRNYIVLARNIPLTLSELMAGSLLDGTRMVIAGGCLTGVSNPEQAPDEPASFATGLLQAGAPCTIATLWPVSDRATFLLMLQFARIQLEHPDRSPAIALREAARWLRHATRAELESLAKTGIEGLRSASSDDALTPDPLRGITDEAEIKEDEAEIEEDQARLSLGEAFTTLAHVAAAQHQTHPYQHPIYWASAVVYGI